MEYGIKSRFAIEMVITETANDWVFGNFFFWMGDARIGDPEDATALNACYNWMRDFRKGGLNRVHDEFYQMGLIEIVKTLGVPRNTKQEYCERFYIDYLGMSTFDHGWDFVLLIKNSNLEERLVWHSKNQKGKEVFLKVDEAESVIDEAVRGYEKEIIKWL
jgi:Immunity protein 42